VAQSPNKSEKQPVKQAMQIGEFASQTGIPIDTLRYYEKLKLIKSERSASGYRLYSEESFNTARFILSAKQLGFSLDLIKQLLSIQVNKQDASCEDVKQFVHVQIQEVDQKLQELANIKRAMERLYNNCCGGKEDASYCSILQALEVGDV
jgi:MerR family Zn(II)-responsive transcriptional regulator of zntA